MAPIQYDLCPYKRGRDAGTWPCDDGGKDWSDASRNCKELLTPEAMRKACRCAAAGVLLQWLCALGNWFGIPGKASE